MRLLALIVLLAVLAPAQSAPAFSQGPASQSPANQTSTTVQLPGSITGTILDSTGAAVVGATVKLSRDDASPPIETQSDADGQFSFASMRPGLFHLAINAAGFAPQTFTSVLQPAEARVIPPLTLGVAPAITEVQVVPLSQVEVAQQQIEQQEQQRMLAVIPNFYVSYVPNAAPLNTRQKFELAWKTTLDPVSFGLIGVIAGIQQAQNSFPGYGQGASGYAKRYGASYANFASGTFIGAAILPSLLKQDPRYFYKGTGTAKSRALYAIANSVICKGDNGRWQPNYSNVLGALAAGGLSNLYYPEEDRNGVKLTFQNALITVGATAAVNLLEEFVIPKPKHHATKP